MIARDMEEVIGFALESVLWANGIYLLDDGSTDGTADVARHVGGSKITIEISQDTIPAFTSGECEIRNRVIEKTFSLFNCDAVVVLDADELLSASVQEGIEKMLTNGHDSVCFSTWHLYDKTHYIPYRETLRRGHYLVDPHIRIIGRGRTFENHMADGSHPRIRMTPATLILDGFHHFHLKYFNGSPYPNYSLPGLPEQFSYNDVKPFLRKLPQPLPSDIKEIISRFQWRPQTYPRIRPSYGRQRIHRGTIRTDCVHYRGEHPCLPYTTNQLECCKCRDYVQQHGIVLVLDIPGAALPQYSALPLLDRLLERYAGWNIVWIGMEAQAQSVIDRGGRFVNAASSVEALLKRVQVDFLFSIHPSLAGAALASEVNARVRKGFGLFENGMVAPLNLSAADYLQRSVYEPWISSEDYLESLLTMFEV